MMDGNSEDTDSDLDLHALLVARRSWMENMTHAGARYIMTLLLEERSHRFSVPCFAPDSPSMHVVSK